MLVRAIGVAACSLLVPITLAVIVVLLFVTLSYGEVVMVHTRAGSIRIPPRSWRSEGRQARGASSLGAESAFLAGTDSSPKPRPTARLPTRFYGGRAFR